VSGKRVAIALLILIVLALQVLYMVNVLTTDPVRTESQNQVAVEIDPRHSVQITVSPAPAPACRPDRADVVPVVADPAITARVHAAWARIEAVLAARTPATAASLRPPAPLDKIARTQARMSVAFPPDLVASLLRHDGADQVAGFEFPPFHRALGLDEILDTWESTCRVLAGHLSRSGWNPAFVPFAAAGDGGYLLVDQRAGGRVGDYYPEDGVRFAGQPPSLTALLEGVATSLETGQPYAGRYRPIVTTSGQLDWDF
jgi:hypothetical protein